MAYVAVTLEYGHEKKDLALPMHVPSRLVLEGVMEILKVNKRRGQTWMLGLKTEQGIRRIPINARLGDSGVLHGVVLTLLEDKQSDVPLPPTGASLKAENGAVFPLPGTTALIGRSHVNRGIIVDVDLTPLDPGTIVSRRHASIEFQKKQYVLIDLGSNNGTWLNGERLTPRQEYPLHEGDVIVFARKGVKVTFSRSE